MIRKIKTIAILLLIINSVSIKAQDFNNFFDSIIGLSSYDTVVANLSTFENLGIKEPGTEALNNTADWIIEKHQQYGYEDIVTDNFVYGGNELYNIIVTKEGTTFPDKYLIIDGHYDTKNGPGANDNGSGLVIIMEIARLLQNIETEYSIKFIYFSAEEEGLVGSSYYVNNTVVPDDMEILLVFNIDEVGGVNGQSNTIITCERDEGPPTSNNEASAAYTDTLVTCVELYSELNTSINHAYGSDYMPFEEVGEIITGLYEYNETPYAHTINDSISNLDLDYIYEITKASTGASLYFSKAYETEDTTTITINEFEDELISIYPNPAKEYLHFKTQNSNDKEVELSIFNTQGQLVLQETIYKTKIHNKININELQRGFYLFQARIGNTIVTQKFVKE